MLFIPRPLILLFVWWFKIRTVRAFSSNATIAEGLACREMLQWLHQNFFDNLELESDSKMMMAGLQHNSTSQGSLLAIVLGDCLSLLSYFNIVSVHFVIRSTNQWAHALAQAVGLGSDPMEWISNAPSYLLSNLQANINWIFMFKKKHNGI